MKVLNPAIEKFVKSAGGKEAIQQALEKRLNYEGYNNSVAAGISVKRNEKGVLTPSTPIAKYTNSK